MPSTPLRIRSADDPEHPEAVVIERFEPLKLKPLYGHQPKGWVVIAWHPSRAAAVETFEQVKVSARERTEQADALLAQLVPPQVTAEEDAAAVHVRKMARIFEAKMEAFRREHAGLTPLMPEAVAKALGESLLSAWETVVERFGKGIEP